LHNKGSPFSLAHKDKIEVMPKDLTFTMTSVATISDLCGRIESIISFHYNTTSNNFTPSNSFGRAPLDVSKLVQSQRAKVIKLE
jgi:hypothetical protein